MGSAIGLAARRVYGATPAGVCALAAAKLKLRELFENEGGEPWNTLFGREE